jgi:aspartyl-tRNA(Asn)/glutamyl-tRNA(Gln) amidotransferase subunit A
MTAPIPDRIIEQLQANLRAANIPATADDIAGMLDKGFLVRVAAFDELVAATPADTIPDMLRDSTDSVAAPTVALPSNRVACGEIHAIAEQIRTRQVSPIELAEQALAAIEQLDPQLNAFQLVLAERARAAAVQAEHEIAAGQYRGPLHGVPVAIKDLLDLAGTPTTAGSQILAGRVAAADSYGAERLSAAGAVIIGKTRMSEFAYSPGSNNAHYGPTRNPRNLDHDTGGSSSGSAAAVASGIVYAALGSDTGGSIRIPAAQCGIVGLKPTYGRISLHGAVTLSWSLDHLGPLTRTVADAALLLDILSGHDPRDPRTRAVAPPTSQATLEGGVQGLRIGVVRDDGTGGMPVSAAALSAWRAGLDGLATQGAELIEIDLPELDMFRTVQTCVLALEAATFHEPWLRERLDDYGEFMRQRVLASYAFGSRAGVQAQQIRAVLRKRCLKLFDRVDVISTPTTQGVAPALGIPGSTFFTGPFNNLGWPAVSVPLKVAPGELPLGMQIIGRPWDEATILRVARAAEQ